MIGEFQCAYEEILHALMQDITATLHDPIKEFIDFEISDALLTRDSFDETRAAQQNAEMKLNRQKKKKDQVQIEYNKTRYRYEKIRDITLTTLSSTNQQTSSIIMEKICNYVELYDNIGKTMQSRMLQVQPQLESARMFLGKEKEQMRLQMEEARKQEQTRRQNLIEEQIKFKETSKDTTLFGESLAVATQRGNNSVDGIPKIIDKLISFLEETAPQQLGVFRVAGSAILQRELIKRIDSGENIDFETLGMDIHTLANIFKRYLRQLPEPLLTYGLWQHFINAVKPDLEAAGIDSKTSEILAAAAAATALIEKERERERERLQHQQQQLASSIQQQQSGNVASRLTKSASGFALRPAVSSSSNLTIAADPSPSPRRQTAEHLFSSTNSHSKGQRSIPISAPIVKNSSSDAVASPLGSPSLPAMTVISPPLSPRTRPAAPAPTRNRRGNETISDPSSNSAGAAADHGNGCSQGPQEDEESQRRLSVAEAEAQARQRTIQSLRSVMTELPPVNYALTRRLVRLCVRVAQD
eukprot:TRINITY_DN569_c0_g1_i3.p1 TRINITY_DN569_c0_g1~~TRINITY_DN569_c0_g1_i3.p1  ORF type:complete len:528 (-),score=91.57 TRINITY_DN569_c0_g1_i3:41-1624(-)